MPLSLALRELLLKCVQCYRVIGVQNEYQRATLEFLGEGIEIVLQHRHINYGVGKGDITRFNADSAIIMPERPSLKPHAIQRCCWPNLFTHGISDLTGVQRGAPIYFFILHK